MLLLHHETRIIFYFFLLIVHSDFAQKPSALLEGLDITDIANKIKTKHCSNHDLKYQRIPHSFSSFSNCLSKQGMVFRGGPCGVMPATSCGGFNCASGIGFPISTVCCKWLVFGDIINTDLPVYIWKTWGHQIAWSCEKCKEVGHGLTFYSC